MLSELEQLRLRVPQLEQEAAEKERAEKLQAALFQIADLASTAENLDQLLHDLHQIVNDLMYAENFYIVLFDETRKFVRFAYFVDTVDELTPQEWEPTPIEAFEKTLTGLVFKTGKAMLVDNEKLIQLEQQEQVVIRGAAGEDWLGVPLRRGDDILGALVVQSYIPEERYDETDKELLVFVSQHIANALQRKQTEQALKAAHEELEKRVEQRTAELQQANLTLQKEIKERKKAEHLQSALYQIAELTNTARDLTEFYTHIHKIVGELMDARNFYIAVHNEEMDTLEFPYLVDEVDTQPQPRQLDPERRATNVSLTEYVFYSGKPLLKDNTFANLANVKTHGPEANTWLGVPLQDGNKIIGVLTVQNYHDPNAYDEKDKELLMFVSQHISAALQRKYDAESLRSAHQELKAVNDQLEMRVQERTQELSAANAILQDMLEERKRIQEKLTHDAFHDALTNLPNRSLFLDRLSHAIQRASRSSKLAYAVFFMDLDRFKVINDSLGHLVGDALLKQVAKRLTESVRPGDTVARLGGDEFCVLLDGAYKHNDVITIAERVLDALASKFTIADQEVFTSTSIGITMSSMRYEQADNVLRDADAAMYQAKAEGKNRYVIFNKAMHKRAMDRLKLESDLRSAVMRGQIQAYYQPIIDLHNNKIIAFEALARWMHHSQGMISPVDFIPIAEETGLIKEIGDHVLTEACSQTQQWRNKLPQLQELSISVNLSSHQIEHQDILKVVDDALAHSQLPPENLRLEITESLLIHNFDAARELLLQLRAKKIEVMLDDFGTGYSSLSYLHKFALSTLKIDRSFVGAMDQRERNIAIVKTIQTLADTLKMKVVAEGIETDFQLEMVKQLNVPFGQGFLFGKPMPAHDAETMLLEQTLRSSEASVQN